MDSAVELVARRAVARLAEDPARVVAGVPWGAVHADTATRVTTGAEEVVPMPLLADTPSRSDEKLDGVADLAVLMELPHAAPSRR